MPEFLDRIRSLAVSDELKVNMLRDIFTILMTTVINAAPNRFSSEEKKKLQELAQSNKYQNIAEELQKQFSEEEWNELISEKINPILKSYEEEVLEVVV
jgi:hypothetical protein